MSDEQLTQLTDSEIQDLIDAAHLLAFLVHVHGGAMDVNTQLLDAFKVSNRGARLMVLPPDEVKANWRLKLDNPPHLC